MRTRTVFIGLGVLSVGVGAGAWLLTRPTPVPAAPIDYKAELIRLTLEGQSTDPNATNGWDALLDLAADASTRVKDIEGREFAADEAMEKAGRKADIEPWTYNIFGAWTCEPKTPRDQRLSTELWQRIAEERVLERIEELREYDVFVMDFDLRLAAVIRAGGLGNELVVALRPIRALSAILEAGIDRSLEAGDWEAAAGRIDNALFLARMLSFQADSFARIWSDGLRRSVERSVVRMVISGRDVPAAFLVRVRESLARTANEAADRVISAELLGAKELTDNLAAELARHKGPSLALGAAEIGADVMEVRAIVDADANSLLAARSVSGREMRAMLTRARSHQKVGMLGPVIETSIPRILESERAMQRDEDAARIIMALSICAIAHGSPPQTLDALVPEFLAELPKDPWAPDGQYRYLPGPTMGDIVLYTVGWDGEDNGGAMMPFHFDIGLREEGKGYDYVFTCDRCKDEPEQPGAE